MMRPNITSRKMIIIKIKKIKSNVQRFQNFELSIPLLKTPSLISLSKKIIRKILRLRYLFLVRALPMPPKVRPSLIMKMKFAKNDYP